MSKNIKVEYEFVNSNDDALAGALSDWMVYLAEKRIKLTILLKSERYRNVYKDIKSKETLLAEFILYD